MNYLNYGPTAAEQKWELNSGALRHFGFAVFVQQVGCSRIFYTLDDRRQVNHHNQRTITWANCNKKKKKTCHSHITGSHPPSVVVFLQMYSERLKGHVLVKELWTAEASGCRTEISSVPENLFKVMFCNTWPCVSDLWATYEPLPSHLVLVAGSEERHVKLQAPAVIAHDVATLGCQFWRQDSRADCDLPQVAERLLLQSEADSRVQTRSIHVWRGCERLWEHLLTTD